MSKPCAHASSGKTARNNNIFSFVVKPRGTSAHPEDLQLMMFVQEAPQILLYVMLRFVDFTFNHYLLLPDLSALKRTFHDQ